MESKTGGESNGCSIQWKIENISHWWLHDVQQILSPAFVADSLEGTKWYLLLLYIGYNDENKVNFHLFRGSDCTGPDHFRVNYRLSFQRNDGSSLTTSGSEEDFCKGYKSSRRMCKAREDLFINERELYISEDTLTVQCEIWKGGETPVKLSLISALTVLKVNRRSFLWKINEFSTLKPGAKIKFKDDVIDFDLVLNEGLELERKLAIHGIFIDKSIKYFSFTTCIINSVGIKEDCETREYRSYDLESGISSTLLFVEKLKKNQNRYLPNDVLSLGCEYVCSNSTVVSYQFCGQGIISPKVTNVSYRKGNWSCADKEETVHTPGLANDMKYLLIDGILSDVELRTSAQSFKVHKNILSARSLVFRRMLSTDTMEKKIGQLDITEFDVDTIQQMLLYMYTDSLEDLELENAVRLYEVADKFEIWSLKSRCSSLMTDNLSPNKACDILVVADSYQDDDLKSAVQDYMLEHEEIFSSQEWKHFMNSNLKLAAETMHRKFLPG